MLLTSIEVARFWGGDKSYIASYYQTLNGPVKTLYSSDALWFLVF